MPLTSTNFIAGKMNKSVDERLIPPGEYIDALNVRLGSTENTEIGAVENSLGNTILTQLEFQGVPLVGNIRTIGVYEDGINETLYWFVHNENASFRKIPSKRFSFIGQRRQIKRTRSVI